MSESTGTIRYNEDYSEYEAILPDGTHLSAEPVPDDGTDWIEHPDDPSQVFVAVLSTYDGGLEANTLYQLTPVATEVEDGCDFDAEDAEEEEAEEPETEESSINGNGVV